MKHLWEHGCNEHACVSAACVVLRSAGSVCKCVCGSTPFAERGSECGRVDAQRSTRQTPFPRGHDRTLPYPKSPPESLASGGPEAPLAPPPRCCCSKRNLQRLCPESGSLKLCPPVRGCDALRRNSVLTSGNTDLPLEGHVEFVQVSCAPFPSNLTEVARFRYPKSPQAVLEHD